MQVRDGIYTITAILSLLTLATWLIFQPLYQSLRPKQDQSYAPAILDVTGLDDGSAYAVDGNKVIFIRDGLSSTVRGVEYVYMITKAGPNKAYAYSVQAVWMLQNGEATPVLLEQRMNP